MGDGFLATFDGPARGIRCARAIADKVRALDIKLRAGLHTGECELVGDDIGGMAVNIGARIGALAGADEVLVSSTVKDLVVGSGISFTDRGAQQLKGVPGEWHVFAVDGVETPASSRLVPDTREQRVSFAEPLVEALAAGERGRLLQTRWHGRADRRGDARPATRNLRGDRPCVTRSSCRFPWSGEPPTCPCCLSIITRTMVSPHACTCSTSSFASPPLK